MNEFIVIFCTISSKDEAKKIAQELVQKKLAACVNIIEGLTSVYEWKNELCTENECLMIIKSRKSLFEEIKNEDRIFASIRGAGNNFHSGNRRPGQLSKLDARKHKIIFFKIKVDLGQR